MSPGNIRGTEPMRVVYINTQYVETDSTSFKSVVQRLTGKDDPRIEHDGSGKKTAKSSEISRDRRGGGGGGSVLPRGVSFKDFDRLLLEMPPLDELYRLCANPV